MNKVVSIFGGEHNLTLAPIEPCRFEILHGEWMKLHAALHVAHDKRSMARFKADERRKDDLEILMAASPATAGWMVQKKLEFCEQRRLTGHGQQVECHAELIMLAGVKADIARFELAGAFG